MPNSRFAHVHRIAPRPTICTHVPPSPPRPRTWPPREILICLTWPYRDLSFTLQPYARCAVATFDPTTDTWRTKPDPAAPALNAELAHDPQTNTAVLHVTNARTPTNILHWLTRPLYVNPDRPYDTGETYARLETPDINATARAVA